MDIYKNDGFLHVYYDEVNKYIVFKWASFAINMEDIQEAVDFGGIVTKNCRDMAEANEFKRSRK